MKKVLRYASIVIYSIFIGSQITEGVLLVPYWQSLSSSEFYAYYSKFGHSIGQFYTILTIIAISIPILLSIYCKRINSSAFKFALISSFFSILVLLSFYIYFKGTNELFFQAALSDIALKAELITWSYWHWGRIVIQFLSLIFLIIALDKIQNTNSN